MIQYLLVAILDVLLGIIALSKKRNLTTVAFSLVAFSLSLWSLELFFLSVIKDLNLLYPIFHITRVGLFFIAPSFALLCWSIVGKKSEIFKKLVVIPCFVLASITALLNLTILPTELRLAEDGYLPNVDLVYYLYGITIVYSAIASVSYCLIRHKSASVRQKKRLKWLAVALLTALVVSMSSVILIRYDFYLSKVAGSATNIVILVALLYPILKHNLMDFSFVLTRGTARLILLTTYIWLYYFLTANLLDSINRPASIVASIIFLAIAVESYQRILHWMTMSTMKFLGNDNLDISATTKQYSQLFSLCIDKKDLTAALDNLISGTIQSNKFGFFISSEVHGKFENLHDKTQVTLLLEKEKYCVDDELKDLNHLFYDESSGKLKELMLHQGFSVCIFVGGHRNTSALVFIGKRNSCNNYGYQAIEIFEWLSVELLSTVKRIRAVEIFEKDLVQAQKKLSVMDMIGHYNHDIKGPLSIIDGVVKHQLYEPKRQREVILEQVELGTKLISIMAGLLRGDRRSTKKPVAIANVLEDCSRIYGHALAGSDIQLTHNDLVVGDADDLKILFMNIIKNSVEACSLSSTPAIEISAWKEEQTVKVSVKDNGVGMSPSQVQSMWSEGKSTKSSGSGIGLIAVKRIADEHNILIDVETKEGAGTNFTLAFSLQR